MPCIQFKLVLAGNKSQILVVNIDPLDKDKPLNLSKWHEQIGQIEADQGVEGISATPDPLKLTFTNRGSDATGYGIIEITNDDPVKFSAKTRYIQLSIGEITDYFDVNEAVSVTVTRDGKYGFVAGFNGSHFGSGIESIDGVQAGSNIGIIENPLGDYPVLVAATRPIPLGLTTDLVLSNDDKYLYASYPLGGGVYVFDVEEISKTIDNPGNYIIDEFGRSLGSAFFDANSQHPATIFDLNSIPVDDINPNISIAADYGIIAENRASNQFTYGVFNGSNRAPVAVGGTPRGLAVAPTDIVDLTAPTSNDSTPTFSWSFDVPVENLEEVNLFVSTFAEGEGLLPWDEVVDLDEVNLAPELTQAEELALLSDPWQSFNDFNPGRILTATWKKETNTWYWYDGETPIAQVEGNEENTSTRLTLPDELALTAGQDYHWAVRGITTTGESDTEVGQFHTTTAPSTNPFSSVSILTHGFSPPYVTPEEIPTGFYELGDKIISVNGNSPSVTGLMMQYDKPSGMWLPVNKYGQILTDVTGGLDSSDPNYLSTLATNIEQQYLNQNKPLVLLSEWVTKGESSVSTSGFTEGAADAIFASLVQLDQALGGEVGISDEAGELIQLYDDEGDLIRTQGAVFNSPLHFIGFSRGTVVTSEMVQRVGTYYPYAGGPIDAEGNPILDAEGNPVRDLQMTTVDPHDFAQESLKIDLLLPTTTISKLDFRNFNEPPVTVWDNVTFADNYYQQLANPNGKTLTPNGRPVEGADLNFSLEGLPGFTEDNVLNPMDTPHGRAFAWYSGTADLAVSETEDVYTGEIQEINDELGDKDAEEILNWFKSGVDSLGDLGEAINSWISWYESEGSHL